MDVVFPIRLDRFQRASTTLLREVALAAQGLNFASFSGPMTEEDQTLSPEFWQTPNITEIKSLQLLTRRFDIAHIATATKSNRLAMKLARMRGAKYLLTANTQIVPTDPYMPEYRKALREADCVVAVSQAVANQIESELGVRAHSVIPNGANFSLYDAQRDRPKPEGLEDIPDRIAAFIGTVEQRKRPDVLVEVAKRCPDITFVVAGWQRDPKLVALLATQPNIINAGALPRMAARDLLSRANVMVFPSDIEGLPLSAIEGLAMGVPLLAQPKSSMPELVVEGLNGSLLPDDQPDRWAEKVRGYFEMGEEAWVKQAVAIREDAESRFSLHQHF